MSDYKQFKKMRDIETRYGLGKTLGQGAFGLVRLCLHKDSGKTFAIKIAMVGKYVTFADSYVSVNEALKHASASIGRSVNIDWIDS